MLAIWLCLVPVFITQVHKCTAVRNQVIPEKANVTYVNEKYYTYARAYVKRYGRKSLYYVNIEARTKTTLANNVTLNMLFYEYLHNEYRRSFVEIHLKLCDMINNDPYLGKMIRMFTNIVCPVVAGEYHLMNLTVPVNDFPFRFPFQKGRVDADLSLTDTKEVMVKAYFYAIFKQQ